MIKIWVKDFNMFKGTVIYEILWKAKYFYTLAHH